MNHSKITAFNIRKLRDSKKLTQEEFGNIAGVSDKAVSSWESGRSTPRLGAAERIAEHFGIPVSMLYQDHSAEQDILLEWKKIIQIPGMQELIEAAKASSEEDIRLATKLLQRLNRDEQ